LVKSKYKYGSSCIDRCTSICRGGGERERRDAPEMPWRDAPDAPGAKLTKKLGIPFLQNFTPLASSPADKFATV